MIQDRFLNKVEKSDGCWLWTGSVSKKSGYGFFYFGKLMSAHRASWLIYNGPIFPGMWVLHKCDNRRCVNPDHLFLGTAKTNTQDMIQKGRKVIATGRQLPQAKIDEEKVRAIRALGGKRSQSQIANMFGISQTTVFEILHRKIWKHVL